jgi:hypothetical protein
MALGEHTMQLPRTFDADTVLMMGRVCYDAWWELRSLKAYPSLAAEENLRSLLALRVMEAVAQGERDPAALRMVALASDAVSSAHRASGAASRQPHTKAGAMVLS